MTLINAIVSAREFAMRAHGTQKYGELPYVVHLDEVAEIALQAILRLDRDMTVDLASIASIVTVAYVHDVLEDTGVSLDSINARFGDPVGMCAELLSDPTGKNRKERKEALHARLSELNVLNRVGQTVLLVKASDRLANLRRSVGLDGGVGNPGLLKTYRSEAPAFRQAAYRFGLCDAVWGEIDKICPV
jgi:(p)ppGpp synthase/HD superfamily hydrolase